MLILRAGGEGVGDVEAGEEDLPDPEVDAFFGVKATFEGDTFSNPNVKLQELSFCTNKELPPSKLCKRTK